MLPLYSRTLAFALLLALVFPAAGFAAVTVAKVGDAVVDAEALTIDGGFGRCINGKSFQQNAVLSLNGWQYLAYYDKARHVCAARRRLPEGPWEVVRFGDYDFKSNDAHNVVSLGICPKDGTIHLSWDHHGHPLKYRVSKKGVASYPEDIAWTPDAFGRITSELEPGKPVPSVTYPRFWTTPDGGLQFCYRRQGSGNGDRMLVDYDPERGAWSGTRQIDSRKGVYKTEAGESASRCSYPNGYDYGPLGKLHVTWVWREGPQTANHDLMYAYSDDAGVTWKNTAGEPFDGPPRVDSPGVAVARIHENLGLINTNGQAVDSKGRIHAVMRHCTEKSLAEAGSRPGEHRWGPVEAWRYVHYWRAENGEWRRIVLPGPAAGRPKVFLDADDNAFLIYDGRAFGDPDLFIAAATAEAEWTDWRVVHVEKGPFINEMLGDPLRWKQEGVLSVMVQVSPEEVHQPTPLRVLDFSVAVE